MQLHFEFALVFGDDGPLETLNDAVVDLLNILDVFELLGGLPGFAATASLLPLSLLANLLQHRTVAGYHQICLHWSTLLTLLLLLQSELRLRDALAGKGQLLLLLLLLGAFTTDLLHFDEGDVEVLLRRCRHADLSH